MIYDISSFQINKELAEVIVSEIGATVNKSINIMNSEGIIIASSDKTRIGQLHEVALRIIQEDLTEIYIDSEDDQSLMRAGLNLPIVTFGKKIGVLGITGSYTDVNVIGPVLKKATEIFLTAEIEKNYQIQDIISKESLVKHWLKLVGPLGDFPKIKQQLESYHLLDWKNYRICSIVYPNRHDLEQTSDGFMRLSSAYSFIRNHFRFIKSTVILKDNYELVIFFFDQSEDMIKKSIIDINSKLSEKMNLLFSAGLDSQQASPRPLDAHNQAVCARRVAEKQHTTLILYDDLTDEILYNDVSREVKIEFFRKLFKNQDVSQMDEWIILLKAHIKNNGSIKQTAEELFVHPNTIQYRLKLIAKKTGHDPRNYKSISLFNAAITIYDDIANKNR